MTPRLLDLFCGAGGAAVGYARAGFEVVGVDVVPQPHFPYEFHLADSLEVLGLDDSRGFDAAWDFDAIHTSPPCRGYADVTNWRGDQADHPRLIEPTRELLEATGLPYVIENVRTRALRHPLMLCGTQFGLPIRRHRYFETNWHGFELGAPCQHDRHDYSFDHGGKQPESVYRDAMETPWMTVAESREAIPPAFTEHLGHRLLAHLRAAKAPEPEYA